MFMDFAFRTTLFRFAEFVGVPVQELKETSPFVKPAQTTSIVELQHHQFQKD